MIQQKIDPAETIRRVTDAGEVEGWFHRDTGETIDLASIIENPLNVCLAFGNGGALFAWHGPGVYELHVSLEQRGKSALFVLNLLIEIMRLHYDARFLWAPINVEKRHVVMFARLMGWKLQQTIDLEQGLCEIYSTELEPCR